MTRLDCRTADPDSSIWVDPPEDTFRRHLVQLEECTNAVPVDPQVFPLRQCSNVSSIHTLPLAIEQQLADDLAFLAAIEEGAQSVAAVCLEEHSEGLTIRFAALDLVLSGEVKNALERIIHVMSLSADASDSAASSEALFEQIVKLHVRRLLARLRSDKWKKPKYLSKQHKKPLWRDFSNIIHRVQFLYAKKEAAARQSVQVQLQSLATNYEAFEALEANSAVEFDSLKELIRASYRLCKNKEVTEFAQRLEASPSSTPTAKVASAIKCLRQIEKIASYARIATSLIDLSHSYPSLFRNKMQLAFLTPFKSVSTEIGYEDWATTCHVHAEVQLAVFYDLLSQSSHIMETRLDLFNKDFRRPRVIGTSKWLCYLCYLFLSCHGAFVPANTHGRLYDQWTVPDLIDYQPELRVRYREILRAMDDKVLQETRNAVSAGAGEPGFVRWRAEPMTSRQNLFGVDNAH
ncbi:hypothetical protein B5807_07101 [Epicoccum nigrum]|uniref:Uncharacterized protein n=1 Tax=Epicoccum nigrum TaxID=105696 RepID=A0A1Y2LY70_EPING|nr:hypothetical protein B5807_07101 [Epicoccum nigrum]